MWLRAYADSEGPGQPAHSRRLTRAFAVRLQKYWILLNLLMESKGPYDLAHAQDDVNLHILRMLEGILSLGAARIMWSCYNFHCNKCFL